MTETKGPSFIQDPMAAAKLAAIVESSVDAIVSKTLDGTVLSWNRAAERIFGYAADEMVGQTIYRLIPPDLHDEESDILERIGRGEQIQHYETTRMRKDGVRITISLTVSPVLDRDGRIVGAASIKRDITEAKRTEEALRQAAKMESIGRLAGGLAHDFNNHLHALTGFLHFLTRDPGLSPGSQEDLAEVRRVTERMATLTHQLLAFARQQVLSVENVELCQIIDEAVPMLRRLIGSNYSIVATHQPGERWIRLDRGQLVQVLMNLVTNARDSMDEGGIIRISTSTRAVAPNEFRDVARDPIAPGRYAVLEITDQGTGIAAEDLPRIFEPFFTTKEIGRGTGLGLATVEGIVSQSGGHIQLQSRPGEGATFRIFFPLAETGTRTPLLEHTSVRSGTGRGRILVVDDDDNVRPIVARLLASEGYDVAVAASGFEALAHLERTAGGVDLLITDMVMPGMGGRELTRRVAASYPDLPVIWMSGYPRGSGPLAVPEEASVHFLPKPIAPDLLFAAARVALRQPA